MTLLASSSADVLILQRSRPHFRMNLPNGAHPCGENFAGGTAKFEDPFH